MMPVIALYFHIITPSVILSNLLAVPVLFVTVILGFGLLFTGLTGFLSPFANIIAGALNVTISFFMTMMQLISHIPFSFVRVSSPNWALITVFYTALAIVVVLSRRAKKYKSLIVIFFLFTANLFLWNEVARGAPPSMRVTFFDVGKTDASLLEFPDESVMLIDGGSGGKKTGGGAGRYVLAPYLWQRGIWRIDCILLTHAHEDHIGGLLYILKNFDVGTVIDSGIITEFTPPEKELYEEFIGIIKKKNVRYLTVERGDVIKGFPGVNFAVLNPPRDRSYGDMNNDSVVVKAVSEKGHSILFCADVESRAIKDMLCFGRLLRSDLLKVPHHAAGLGDGSVIRDFVNKVQCAGAVITNNSLRNLLTKSRIIDPSPSPAA
jgi:competence protein ComEC